MGHPISVFQTATKAVFYNFKATFLPDLTAW